MVNGVENDEDVTEFRILCDPSDECCATRTWNDNKDEGPEPTTWMTANIRLSVRNTRRAKAGGGH